MSKIFRPEDVKNVKPNVFLDNSKGYYDKNASLYERLILFEGSSLNIEQGDETIIEYLNSLVREGYLEVNVNCYIVKKTFSGSPSGTAAAVLGEKCTSNPNGYRLWKYTDGKTIEEAGEKPIRNKINRS